MDWMKVAEEHAENRTRQLLFIGLPSMAAIVLAGAVLYAAASGIAKLLGF